MSSLVVAFLMLAAPALAQQQDDGETIVTGPRCYWRQQDGECFDREACESQGRGYFTGDKSCTTTSNPDNVCCIPKLSCSYDGKTFGDCITDRACTSNGGVVNNTCQTLPYNVNCCFGATVDGVGASFRLPQYSNLADDLTLVAVDDNEDAWLSDYTLNTAGLTTVGKATTTTPKPGATTTTTKATTTTTKATTAPLPPAVAQSSLTLRSVPTSRCDIVAPVCTHMRATCSTPFLVDIEFMPFVAAYNKCARDNGVRLNVCSSYRSLTRNRAVGGASMSNHLVGHGIDFSVVDRSGVVCTEACLLSARVRNARPGVQAALACIDRITNSAWGGNPGWNINIRGHLDVVHVDDRLNVRYLSRHVAKRTACDADSRRPMTTASCAAYESQGSFLREENDFVGKEGDVLDEVPEPADAVLVSSGAADGSQTALIAGVVGGIAAALVALGVALFCFVRTRRAVAARQARVETAAAPELSVAAAVEVQPSAETRASTDAGSFVCNKCEKAYEYADDLAQHFASRH